MKPGTVLTVIRYLRGRLECPVGISKPSNAEVFDECVTVERIGTSRTLPAKEVDAAAISVTVYAETPDRCIELAGEVSSIMEGLIDTPRIVYVREYSAYPQVDAANKPIFRLQYQITYTG